MSDHLAVKLAAGAGGFVLVIAVLAGAAGAGLASMVGLGFVSAPTPYSAAAIPAGWLALYRAAAATCPGLPWSVLAAIGSIESGNGASGLPGVRAGANRAGAEGPMQFEPGTFLRYAEPVPPGGADPPSPYDPIDAVYAAARDLCSNGARGGADVPAAVFAYNHAQWYVAAVLARAQQYAASKSVPDGGSGVLGSLVPGR
jgi:membrane-bound lytic murein transglycosylase B